MFPFPPTVTPAVRSHLDAQTAFVNDISRSLFRSFQHLCDLNIQLAQTLLEESALASRQVLGAERHTEVLGAAAARAQPTTDKLRAYQQHIARVAADAQVELARVAEQHVQNATRTARALVDEVARSAAEETERGLRTQQEAMRNMADPFARPDGAGGGMHMGSEEGKAAQRDMEQGMQQARAQASADMRPPGSATH
ncbi:granule-associated protein [Massilia sp. KIM]|uniref:phasin family protein n=1 Tax=Massilia sp. KIM TaxID=1955422 RepID=UPI00098F1ED3|nr:phasin family protein [Massilia sp. KIM]OON62157.1 granule-associated protein [Massilia sp. KIM]